MGEIPFLTIIQTKFPGEYIGKISSLRMTIAALGFTLGVLLASPMFFFLNTRLAIAAFPVLLITVGTLCLVRFANTPFMQIHVPPQVEHPVDQPL